MFKKCFECGRRKPIDHFYAHDQMDDGHLGKCKVCIRKDVIARYKTPSGRAKVQAYDKIRNATPERKAARRLYQQRRRLNRPGVDKARNAVANAIRDKRLVRLPCEVCGNPKSEAHHEDYRRKLYVRWLCFKHHREAHGQIIGQLKQ